MLNKFLKDSWNFFKIHYLGLMAIILPIIAPVKIFNALYEYHFAGPEFFLSEQFVPLVVGLLALPLYSVGIVFYLSSVVSGEPIDSKTSWMLGVKFWAPYFVLSLMVGTAVMSGFMLFVIPGVLFAIRFSFSEFDLLFNGSRPLDAMKNSWHATRKYMGVIIGGYAIITAVLYVPYIFVASVLNQSSASFWMFDILSGLIYAVLNIFYTIFAFRVYDFSREESSGTIGGDVV